MARYRTRYIRKKEDYKGLRNKLLKSACATGFKKRKKKKKTIVNAYETWTTKQKMF
jgi:hypothetical protein